MWKEILNRMEAVLFDLDGTVIDSMWIWKNIDKEYFKKCHIDMPSGYQQEIEGLSFYETAVYTHDNYVPWISIEKLMEDWNEMAFEHYANIVKPKEYVRDFLEYLKNENIDGNLAFSFQMQMKCEEYYPGLTRKIYLKGYRYNMHLKPRSLLVELGAQNNTVREAMNACDPLAHALDLVLSGR